MKRFCWKSVLALMAVALSAGAIQAAVINVPAGGSIQAAVNVAAPGDTIVVAPGTFKETVIISTSGITLLGAQAGVDPRFGGRVEGGPGETIIDGEGIRTEGIIIRGASGAWLTDVVIDGFEIVRPTYAGVRFEYASATTLKYTMVHHCTTNEGIKTRASCSDLLIQKVISHNNFGDGIEFGDYGSYTRLTVEDCDIFDNEDRGIYLYQVDQVALRRVRTFGNKGTVTDWHQGGLIAYNCTSNTYTDIEAFNNVGSGIHLYKENYDGITTSVMNGTNKVHNNLPFAGKTPGDGIRVYLSRNISIQGAECYVNDRHGICVGSVGQYGNLTEHWGDLVFMGNSLHNNKGAGLMFEGGTAITGLNCAATCNEIENNVGYGLNNAAVNTVAATDNWWGDPSGPGGSGPGSGDEVSTKVTFSPWLTGTDIDVTPAVLSFADTLVNTGVNLDVTIKNAAACVFNLEISAINLASGEFTIVGGGTPPPPLAPGATHTVTIQFKPTSNGFKTADLYIESNVPGKSPSHVALQGTGIGPLINVAPASLAFADTLVGSADGPQTIIVKNEGTADLSASAALIGTGFGITNGGAFILSPGQSRSIGVIFSPATVGPIAAEVLITHDDPGKGPISAALTGEGLPMAATSFTVEEAKLDWKKKPDDDKARVQGVFNLPDAAVPDPNAVTLKIGGLTFGPIAMTKVDDKKWEYKRPKGTTGIKDFTIEWKKKEAKFEIHIDDADLGEMNGWSNPVTISLLLGTYQGTATVPMVEHKDKWESHK